jgi:hypothetical protein
MAVHHNTNPNYNYINNFFQIVNASSNCVGPMPWELFFPFLLLNYGHVFIYIYIIYYYYYYYYFPLNTDIFFKLWLTYVYLFYYLFFSHHHNYFLIMQWSHPCSLCWARHQSHPKGLSWQLTQHHIVHKERAEGKCKQLQIWSKKERIENIKLGGVRQLGGENGQFRQNRASNA